MYGGDVISAATANPAVLGYVHYLHGVNPLGLVYLMNMKSTGAEHSASTMFHNWFAHGSVRWSEVGDATPGPAPGYLVGGPNQDYSMDKCCIAPIGTPEHRCFFAAAFALCRNSYAPPLGQPPLKSYRQFNDGWPVNSWEVTEPSTAYQAQYIRVLTKYVR
jgi:endoglucanase